MSCNDQKMPSVWVDSEEVLFKDGIPLGAAEVYDDLMRELDPVGRIIVEFVVDGIDILRTGENPESFSKIEAKSQTHHELTLRLVMETSKHLVHMEEHMQAYAVNVLKTSWVEVFERMDELIAKIKPFAELFDNLVPYVQTYDPPWRETFESIASEQACILEGIMDSFERASPAILSDTLACRFCTNFKEASDFFSSVMIPFLKDRVTDSLFVGRERGICLATDS